jgi:hypothetical protein
MFLLSIVWLYFFIAELVGGLTPTQETIIYVIWLLFIAEFLIKFIVTPRKPEHLLEDGKQGSDTEARTV